MDPKLDARAVELGERYGYPMPVARLLALGRPALGDPDRWISAAELELSTEHVPELIRLMMDGRWDTLEASSPAVYAPVHAWRALGDLRAEEAIPALTALLFGNDEVSDDWVSEDVPVVLGLIGAGAIPALESYLGACRDDRPSCLSASSSIAQVGMRHPEEHDRCVQILMAKLEGHGEQHPALNGFLVGDLVDLKAQEAIPTIRAAFEAGSVDESIQGDLEDVEILLGLRQERSTPAEPFVWARSDPAATGTSSADEGRDVRGEKAKKKAKRKQAEQTRKKARQRKKR